MAPKNSPNTPDETPDQRRERLARELAEVAFDDAYEIREQYIALVQRRKANREQIRSLAAQDMLTDEQRVEADELYPIRQKSDDTDDAEADGTGAESASPASETPKNATAGVGA